MEQIKFEAMLILIVPQVVHLIVENYKYNEVDASRNFYEL